MLAQIFMFVCSMLVEAWVPKVNKVAWPADHMLMIHLYTFYPFITFEYES